MTLQEPVDLEALDAFIAESDRRFDAGCALTCLVEWITDGLAWGAEVAAIDEETAAQLRRLSAAHDHDEAPRGLLVPWGMVRLVVETSP